MITINLLPPICTGTTPTLHTHMLLLGYSLCPLVVPHISLLYCCYDNGYKHSIHMSLTMLINHKPSLLPSAQDSRQQELLPPGQWSVTESKKLYHGATKLVTPDVPQPQITMISFTKCTSGHIKVYKTHHVLCSCCQSAVHKFNYYITSLLTSMSAKI